MFQITATGWGAKKAVFSNDSPLVHYVIPNENVFNQEHSSKLLQAEEFGLFLTTKFVFNARSMKQSGLSHTFVSSLFSFYD